MQGAVTVVLGVTLLLWWGPTGARCAEMRCSSRAQKPSQSMCTAKVRVQLQQCGHEIEVRCGEAAAVKVVCFHTEV